MRSLSEFILSRAGRTRDERLVWFVEIAVVVLGIALRARGYWFGTFPLWLDEATWAILLVDQPLQDHLIRPIGLMAVTKGLAALFGPSEAVLRFLPFSAGVGATLLAPLLGRRVFSWPGARLLFVAVIALHPAAIDLSKEFKPYAVGLAVYLLAAHVTLRYLADKSRRSLVLLLAVLVPGVLFTPDIVFAYPGIFILAGVDALRGKRKRQLLALAASALVIVGLLVALYFLMWRRLDADESDYWGQKYRVFHVPRLEKNGYLEWWLDRYRGMTTLPGMRRDYFHSRLFSGSSISTIKSIDRQVWTGLHLLGLWMLVVRRRGRDALLFCAPLLVLSAFNWAGRWPLGIFRTNLFTLPYFAAIAAIAVDRRLPARSSLLSGAVALVPTFLLVLLPLGLFEKSWHSKKYAFTTTSRWPEILERLLETSHEVPSARRETLVIDRGGCDPFLYYTRYHPELSVRYGRPFQQRFESHCVRKARRLNHFLLPALDSAGTRAWIVSARVKSFRKERAKWPATFVVDPRAMVGPTRILSVERR